MKQIALALAVVMLMGCPVPTPPDECSITPYAAFSVNAPGAGFLVPVIVTDESVLPCDSALWYRQWDYGNGVATNRRQAARIVRAPATLNVSLTVATTLWKDTATQTVEVLSAPPAEPDPNILGTWDCAEYNIGNEDTALYEFNDDNTFRANYKNKWLYLEGLYETDTSTDPARLILYIDYYDAGEGNTLGEGESISWLYLYQSTLYGLVAKSDGPGTPYPAVFNDGKCTLIGFYTEGGS